MEGELQPPHTGQQDSGRQGLPPQLRVIAWRDELVEAQGFEPRSMYVETCWLPVMGPTATFLYRRLGSWAAHNPDGITVDTQQLSESLGLGDALGRHSRIGKAIGRLARYHAARLTGDELQVRTALPPLPLRLVKGLDANTKRLHERYTAAPRRDRTGLVK